MMMMMNGDDHADDDDDDDDDGDDYDDDDDDDDDHDDDNDHVSDTKLSKFYPFELKIRPSESSRRDKLHGAIRFFRILQKSSNFDQKRSLDFRYLILKLDFSNLISDDYDDDSPNLALPTGVLTI